MNSPRFSPLGLALAALLSCHAGLSVHADVPQKKTLEATVASGVEALRKANPGIERARARHRLLALGVEALEPLRRHLATTDAGEARDLHHDVAIVLLAQQFESVIVERMQTGLFFDGQYHDLKKAGDDARVALLFLIEDEDAADGIRRGALNALADVGGTGLLDELRGLQSDVLLPGFLREEIGTVLAIFGDTRKIDRRIKEISKLLDDTNPAVVVAANSDLAHLYYKIRKYSRATECYERILEVFDNLEKIPTFRAPPGYFRERALHQYNAACSYSLAGDLEKARASILKAVEMDPMHFVNMEKDGDLRRLREDVGYAEFREKLAKLLEERSI